MSKNGCFDSFGPSEYLYSQNSLKFPINSQIIAKTPPKYKNRALSEVSKGLFFVTKLLSYDILLKKNPGMEVAVAGSAQGVV